MKNPLKINIKTEALPLLLIVIEIVASFYFFKHFPDRVATHWGINGEANGWSSKTFAAFFFPALTISIYLLFLVLPAIDPRRRSYDYFAKAYLAIRTTLVAFLVFMYFITGFKNIGYPIDIGAWVIGAIGFMFLIMGKYMGELKSNWFIGIRTPWTLSSDNIWEKTHYFAGKIFMIGGVFLIISNFIYPSFRLLIFVEVVATIVLAPLIYSYILYSKKKKHDIKSS